MDSRSTRRASMTAKPWARAARAAARAAAASRPSGTRNFTWPAAASRARAARSGYPPVTSASQAGSATPCSSPVVSRTASTRRFTQGMPPSSAPPSPASRRTARSTDTVEWLRAMSTMGCPAIRAR